MSGDAPAEAHAVRLHHLSKHYGRTVAVDGVDLAVRRGEVFGFLGPNGAGKTTTIRMMMGLLRPSHGTATVLGRDAWRDGVAARRGVGYVPGEFGLYHDLTPRRLARFVASLRRVSLDPRDLDALAAQLQVPLDTRIRDLSHGNRRKASVLAALAPGPDLLVLDEPTQGLDPVVQEEVHGLIRAARAAGRTVFLSSHDLHEVAEVCDRVALLRGGRLVAVESVRALLAQRPRRFQAAFAAPVLTAQLASLPGATGIEVRGNQVRGHVQPPVGPFLQAIARLDPTDLVLHGADLEEYVLAHYREAPRA